MWYFHQEILLLGKNTRVSGNHMSLEMKTVSCKQGKGCDCKNCKSTRACNEDVTWVYFAVALAPSPKRLYINWSKNQNQRGFEKSGSTSQYWLHQKLWVNDLWPSYSTQCLHVLMPAMKAFKGLYQKKKKKGYLLILTMARHNQQQAKGLPSHLCHHRRTVVQVLAGRPGARGLWKASLESTCCKEVQAGLHALIPTVFFNF